jgi:hypothetical protein
MDIYTHTHSLSLSLTHTHMEKKGGAGVPAQVNQDVENILGKLQKLSSGTRSVVAVG